MSKLSYYVHNKKQTARPAVSKSDIVIPKGMSLIEQFTQLTNVTGMIMYTYELLLNHSAGPFFVLPISAYEEEGREAGAGWDGTVKL